MAYGILKCDTITFTSDGVDKSVAISGLVQNPTFTGNITVTGTVSGNTVRGQTISGVTITGTTAQFASGTFVSLTGTTLQGTTATYTTGSFTSLTGTTTSGTTANFVSGVFSTQISGVTVTGTTANFTSGNFTNISGGTHTITSGVFASGTAANPSISFVSDPNSGLYSPGADQVAISTNGTGRLFVDASGRVGVGTSSPGTQLDVALPAGTGTPRVRFDQTSSNPYVELQRFSGATNEYVGIRIRSSDNTAGVVFERAASALIGSQTFTESMRLDSSGRLGLGTSTFASGGGQGTGTSAQINGSLYVYEGNNSADHGGAIAFGVNNLATYTPMAQIKGKLEFSAGTELQGGIGIFTRPVAGGASGQTLTERITVKANGNVGIGTTSPSYKLHTNASADDNVILNTAGSGYAAYFVANGGGRSGLTGALTLISFNDASATITNKSNAALTFGTNDQERARIDSSGRLLVGTSSSVSDVFGASTLQVSGTDGNLISAGRYGNNEFAPIVYLRKSRGSLGAQGLVSSGDNLGTLAWTGSDGTGFIQGATIKGEVDGTPGTNDMPGRLVFSTTADGASSPTERMRITNGGLVVIGNTTATGIDITSASATGSQFEQNGAAIHVRGAQTALFVGRQTDDGNLVGFYQAGVNEGSISVSGTTVSYNGAHLSRWSQLPNGAERTEILRGTVLSNIDEMCGWGEEDNEQLNRMKVSDVEGDPNVSGVFQSWDDDDDTYTDDFYCAMTGDFIIRVAEGVTVQRGDLLMSAGDGTAKPQDDDIIRSKTIAKVTSNHITCTYDDGSYCVPCVLMAC